MGFGTANSLAAEAGVFSDLLRDTLGASDRARGLFPIVCNNSARFDQLGKAPDMFVPLVLGEVAAVKALGSSTESSLRTGDLLGLRRAVTLPNPMFNSDEGLVADPAIAVLDAVTVPHCLSLRSAVADQIADEPH